MGKYKDLCLIKEETPHLCIQWYSVRWDTVINRQNVMFKEVSS